LLYLYLVIILIMWLNVYKFINKIINIILFCYFIILLKNLK
jgi:hypothetical protein